MRVTVSLLLACASFASCDQAPPAQAQAPVPAPAPAAPVTVSEADAERTVKALSAAMHELRWEEARALAAQVQDLPDGPAKKAARRMLQELEVVGRPAPALEVERWFQGNTDFTQGQATLVVFWEVWCPHCRRELPELETTWTKYQGKGLNLVALTRASKGVTPEQIQSFITDNKLSYPIALLGDEKLNQAFGVSGIPAAAVVKDGVVLWRGHPGNLDDSTLERLLG